MKRATMSSAPATPDDLRAAFRAAMRKVTSTVCVVTAAEAHRWTGMTMTAVTSVSLEPPALLICANKASGLHALLTPQAHFCVNILRRGQDDVAAAFGGGISGEDRFAVGAWTCQGGAPYLLDALGSVFCSVAGVMDYGSHAIVIGQVAEVRFNAGGAPLIYGDGRYGPA